MADLSIAPKYLYDDCPHCQEGLFLFHRDQNTNITTESWRCNRDQKYDCPISFYRNRIGTMTHYSFKRLAIIVKIFPSRLKKKPICLYPVIGGCNETKIWPDVQLPYTELDFLDLEALDNKIKFWLTFQ